mgnify:CR=1 FL=1
MKRIRLLSKRMWIRIGRAGACAAAGGVLLFVIAWIGFPFPESRLKIREYSTVFTADNNQIIRITLSRNDEYCIPVELKEISPSAVQATLAVEDQRFYSHCGVDGTAVMRAVLQNIFSLKKESGASTITMQVVRMAYNRRRTFISKAFESFRALQLERIRSKEEILEIYLNTAPYGGNIYGIEAASLRYFNKGAKDLNLAEASLLAGLPQSPSRYRPDRYAQRAYRRRRTVLRRMHEEGYISARQARRAAQTEFNKLRFAFPLRAPHLTDALCAEGRTGFVPTTVDLELQRKAERVLRKHVAKLAPHRVSNGSVIILDVKNAAIRAMVGSTDYWSVSNSGQINGALIYRSAGSTVKPFLYTLAYESCRIIPQTTLFDVPVCFNGYVPENYDNEFVGCISARESLALSRNVPAVCLLRQTGIAAFYHCLKKTGFNGVRYASDHYGLTLALGTCTVSLRELADGYACLARLGKYIPSAMTHDDPGTCGKRIFSPRAVWLTGTSFTGPEKPLGGKCIFKTGTSWGYRDLWCVACDADYVVAVWLGNFNNSRCVKICGQEAALPVAEEIFTQLANAKGGYRNLPRPEGIRTIQVCAQTGLRPSDACPCRTSACAIDTQTELPVCRVHHHVLRRLGNGITQLSVQEEWPDPVVSWRSGIERAESDISAPPELRIQSPQDSAEFRMVGNMGPVAQKIALIAAGDTRKRQYWFVNGEFVGTTAAGHSLTWPICPGRHRISVTDEQMTDSCLITVK